MNEKRAGMAALLAIGVLCIGGASGVALGQFTINGIDPQRSSLYAAASPMVAEPATDSDLSPSPVIATSVPPWSERMVREAMSPEVIHSRYDDAAFDDDGVRLASE